MTIRSGFAVMKGHLFARDSSSVYELLFVVPTKARLVGKGPSTREGKS